MFEALGMRERVVCDFMPFSGDAFGEQRILQRIVPDQEKCRAHAHVREHVEKQRGRDRVRAVVEGQRNEFHVAPRRRLLPAASSAVETARWASSFFVTIAGNGCLPATEKRKSPKPMSPSATATARPKSPRFT